MMEPTITIPTLDSTRYQSYYFNDDVGLSMGNSVQFFNREMLKRNIAPHRLDFYMVQLVTMGQGKYQAGHHQHYVNRNMLVFAGPNVITSWRADDDTSKGYGISFAETFFVADKSNKQYLADLPFFRIGEKQIICLTDEQARSYEELFVMLRRELSLENISTEALRGYVQVLLAKAHAEYTATTTGTLTTSSSLRIVKSFMDAYMNDVNVIRNGQEINVKKVSEYAAILGISQNHLNDTVKSVTGKSAGQLLREQILKQATMCLKHSSKTVSEIAYLMGFQDPSYFARFYKKQTGRMPSELKL